MKKFKDRYVLGIGYPNFRCHEVGPFACVEINDENGKIIKFKPPFNLLESTPKYHFVLQRVRPTKSTAGKKGKINE